MEAISEGAIDKIINLVESREKTIEIGNKTYSRFNYTRIVDDRRPGMLVFSTLGGLADYVQKNLDGVKPEECVVVIDGFNQVSLYTPVKGEKNDRSLIAIVKLEGVEDFPFGKFIEQEEFIIKFSALFYPELDKGKILSCVSTMVVKVDQKGEDTGGANNKTATKKIEIQGDEPGPVVELKPYRTFRELDQPKSKFIFRYKDFGGTPAIALYEADGGAWKIEAKKRIKEYLEETLKETPILC